MKGYVSGGAIVAECEVPDSFDGKDVIITMLDTLYKNEKPISRCARLIRNVEKSC